jgi:hypothetical protein
MTVNELLNDLRKEAKLVLLMKSGLISPKTLQLHDVYLRYDILIKQGCKNSEAVSICSKEFKICTRSVYYSVKKCLELIK